jgi:hypothetical protein
MKSDPLPEEWWRERPEILDGVFFSRKPRAIPTGATLIYYAVGRGCVCGVVEVAGPATTSFIPPATFTAARRQKFPFRMPVKLLWKCRADANALLFKSVHGKHVARGSYQTLDEREAKLFIAAIRQRAI